MCLVNLERNNSFECQHWSLYVHSCLEKTFQVACGWHTQGEGTPFMRHSPQNNGNVASGLQNHPTISIRFHNPVSYILLSNYQTRNTAFRRPWVFCDQRYIMDDFEGARANRILFDVIFKAVNLLFWCIFSKTGISPRRNYNFWGSWEFPN